MVPVACPPKTKKTKKKTNKKPKTALFLFCSKPFKHTDSVVHSVMEQSAERILSQLLQSLANGHASAHDLSDVIGQDAALDLTPIAELKHKTKITNRRQLLSRALDGLGIFAPHLDLLEATAMKYVNACATITYRFTSQHIDPTSLVKAFAFIQLVDTRVDNALSYEEKMKLMGEYKQHLPSLGLGEAFTQSMMRVYEAEQNCLANNALPDPAFDDILRQRFLSTFYTGCAVWWATCSGNEPLFDTSAASTTIASLEKAGIAAVILSLFDDMKDISQDRRQNIKSPATEDPRRCWEAVTWMCAHLKQTYPDVWEAYTPGILVLLHDLEVQWIEDGHTDHAAAFLSSIRRAYTHVDMTHCILKDIGRAGDTFV